MSCGISSSGVDCGIVIARRIQYEAKERRMRVCLVVPYDLSIEGGVQNHAVCLAAALRWLGDQVELIGPASAPVDLPDTTTFGGIVSIQSNGSDNRLGLLTSPLQVRSYLRKRRFDVLHVHEPMNPILAFYATWWATAQVKIATFHCFAERRPSYASWKTAPSPGSCEHSIAPSPYRNPRRVTPGPVGAAN